MNRCDQARRLFGAYWDDEVTQAEREWLESHLGGCPACRQQYEQFARTLASYCDVYVNDAFGTAHRAHASTAGMVKFVAEKGAGFVMAKEIDFLSRLLGEVDRPYVAVLGGAKVSDKIEVLDALLERVNAVAIGGAMANTFLAARASLRLRSGKRWAASPDAFLPVRGKIAGV